MSIIATASALLGKIILGKKLDKLTKSMSRKTYVIQTLKALGLTGPKAEPDFASIYAHALVEFVVEAYVEEKDYQKLFAHKAISSLIKNNPSRTEKSKAALLLKIRKAFNSEEGLEKLRTRLTNEKILDAAFNKFLGFYDAITASTATPLQAQMFYEQINMIAQLIDKNDEIMACLQEVQSISVDSRDRLEILVDAEYRRTFNYQIKQYLQTQIIDPFVREFVKENRYVPLIGYREILVQKGDRDMFLVDGRLESMEGYYDPETGKPMREYFQKPTIKKEYFRPIDSLIKQFLSGGFPENPGIMVLLGEYGTGKTTLFQYIAYLLAKQHLIESEVPTLDSRKRIPLMIPLRDFRGEDLKDYVVEKLKKQGIGDFSSSDLIKRIDEGQFVLIFDGFDEVISKDLNEKARKSVHAKQFLSLIPEHSPDSSPILLSTREEYFGGKEELERVFNPGSIGTNRKVAFFHLDTFTDDQIRDFLEKNKLPGQNADELLATIENTFDLKDLAVRAVLLKLIIKYLPELAERKKGDKILSVELYDAVFKDEIRRVNEDIFKDSLPISVNDFHRRALRMLATELHTKNRLTFSIDDVDRILGDLGQTLPEGFGQSRISTIFHTYSFLLPSEEGGFRFSHKSFRDYLIAEAQAEEIKTGNIQEFGKQLNTDEVTTFLAEMRPDPEKLEKLLKNSKGLGKDSQYQGSNALKALLQLDKDWLAGKHIYNAEITQVDFTQANLKGCTFADCELIDCTWDMNMFNLNLSQTVIRGGGGYFWGRDYLGLGYNDQQERIRSYPEGANRFSDLSSLSLWGGLAELDLSYTQVSDLGPLKDLHSLNSLNLRNTQVSDLGPLKDLHSLNSLDLSYTQVSDLGPLKDLHSLNSLDVSYTQVSDLGPLKDLHSLNSLDLRSTKVSDLGPLKDLQSLNSLYLADTQVSDLGPLKDLRSLTRIRLSSPQALEPHWKVFMESNSQIEFIIESEEEEEE